MSQVYSSICVLHIQRWSDYYTLLVYQSNNPVRSNQGVEKRSHTDTGFKKYEGEYVCESTISKATWVYKEYVYVYKRDRDNYYKVISILIQLSQWHTNDRHSNSWLNISACGKAQVLFITRSLHVEEALTLWYNWHERLVSFVRTYERNRMISRSLDFISSRRCGYQRLRFFGSRHYTRRCFT